MKRYQCPDCGTEYHDEPATCAGCGWFYDGEHPMIDTLPVEQQCDFCSEKAVTVFQAESPIVDSACTQHRACESHAAAFRAGQEEFEALEFDLREVNEAAELATAAAAIAQFVITGAFSAVAQLAERGMAPMTTFGLVLADAVRQLAALDVLVKPADAEEEEDDASTGTDSG